MGYGPRTVVTLTQGLMRRNMEANGSFSYLVSISKMG